MCIKGEILWVTGLPKRAVRRVWPVMVYNPVLYSYVNDPPFVLCEYLSLGLGGCQVIQMLDACLDACYNGIRIDSGGRMWK